MCRSHFHPSALHPWLTDSKSLSHPSNHWVSSFSTAAAAMAAAATNSSDPVKPHSPSLLSENNNNNTINNNNNNNNSNSNSNNALFSFPPTPPKDHTPDSIAISQHQSSQSSNSNHLDYQNAVAAHAMGMAFMHDTTPHQQHQHQHQHHNMADIKPVTTSSSGPILQNGSSSVISSTTANNSNKQREGNDSRSSETYENRMLSSFSNSNLFDSAPYAATSTLQPPHPLPYSNPYVSVASAAVKHQLHNVISSHGQNSNKVRNKSRTSAGKNLFKKRGDDF